MGTGSVNRGMVTMWVEGGSNAYLIAMTLLQLRDLVNTIKWSPWELNSFSKLASDKSSAIAKARP